MTPASTPIATNIGRHVNLGMIHAHSSMVTGAALLASREMMAQRRPRVFAGANSLTIAYPVTISAPRPMPAPRRHTVRKVILGEKAPMSVKPPNSSRFSWYATRRPLRSPTKPASSEPMSRPAKPADRK